MKMLDTLQFEEVADQAKAVQLRLRSYLGPQQSQCDGFVGVKFSRLFETL